MASTSRTRNLLICAVVLAGAGALVGIVLLASRPMSSTMAGMDMGSAASTHGVVEAAATPSVDQGHGSGNMPGMDMPASEMPQGDPTPAPPTPTPESGNMPGMDMPASEMPQGDPTAVSSVPGPMSGEMPGMDHGHGGGPVVAADRPLAPVLGTFGGGASAVMLTAGFLRRKDRAAAVAKKAARAAGRGRK